MSTRRRLPKKRRGETFEARVGGHKVYIRTGEYEDGTLGEVFVDMAKIGSFSRGILHCWARMLSLGLQFGIPVSKVVEMFSDVEFAPNGAVEFAPDRSTERCPSVKSATSIVDYTVRLLACLYLGR